MHDLCNETCSQVVAVTAVVSLDVLYLLPDKIEENPKLQAVVSLLTTGPVGISDRIGYTDVDLVRRSSLF